MARCFSHDRYRPHLTFFICQVASELSTSIQFELFLFIALIIIIIHFPFLDKQPVRHFPGRFHHRPLPTGCRASHRGPRRRPGRALQVVGRHTRRPCTPPSGLCGQFAAADFYLPNLRALQRASKYFVEDPEKACVLVPNFEHTLASNEMGTSLVIAQTLRSLPTWERYGGPGNRSIPSVCGSACVCVPCAVCRVCVCGRACVVSSNTRETHASRIQPPAVQQAR